MTTPKNIVVCLDGTGNQIEENLSNVLKLYRALDKNDDQLVFYDQGVGTLKKTYTWGKITQKLQLLIGLAFGYGLDRNVLQAYRFIVRHYSENTVSNETIRDNIYIFGFSRGAHTARVLAGLIYEIGVLRPEQIHLSDAALMAYKQSVKQPRSSSAVTDTQDESEGVSFRRVIRTRTASIRFMGLFDTVSAVFVPNANGLLPPLIVEKLPHTFINPAVRCFRHAMAVDECRRMFRVDRWKQEQEFKPNRHAQGSPVMQDVKEVWFSGYHSDVGGGYKREDSGLSQFSLIWMLDEAKEEGLHVFDRMARYVSGQEPYSSNTTYLYPKPDATATAHNSMNAVWRTLEVFPKPVRHREWPKRRSLLGFYLPLVEPRAIASEDHIHSSVRDRQALLNSYNPVNLTKAVSKT